MIERLCLLLLHRAARRWGDGGEMLAEWRAELSTMDNSLDRLKYALSLAFSRPHRTPGVLPLWRSIPGLVLSLVLLLVLPVVYLNLAITWWGSFSSDTVGWQSWLAAGNATGAVVLAVACAHLTAGLTNVIKPLWLSTWVFGLPFAFFVSVQGLSLQRADYIDLTAGLAGGIVFGIMAVRLTLLGHKAWAWACVAVGTPIVVMLANMHGVQWYFYPESPMSFFDSALVTAIFDMATQPMLHIIIFKLAYTCSLAARVRTVDLPQREAVRSPL